MYNFTVDTGEGIAVTEKNSLEQRVRDGLLFDNYGSLLTERQRAACDMILLQDLSLAEAAEALGVSRQGVHDLISRARERMEGADKAFGVVVLTQKLERICEVLEENKSRLPGDLYTTFKKLLGA